MLKSLIEKFKAGFGRRETFDPASLNDSIALKVGWTPLKKGGSNFRTHKLVEAGLEIMVFRATLGAKLFGLVFVLMGAGVPGFIIYGGISEGGASVSGILFPALIGLVFVSVGVALIYHFSKPIVFDRQSGFFWKGRRHPQSVVNPAELKVCVALEDVYALQILSEYCSGKDNSYYSYELNLVLKSGERINVTDHGSLRWIREDAGRLSQFLGCPLWDAA